MIEAKSSALTAQNGIGSIRVSRVMSGVLAGHIQQHRRDADGSNRDGRAPHFLTAFGHSVKKSVSIRVHPWFNKTPQLTLMRRSLWNQSASQCKVMQGFFLPKNPPIFSGHFDSKTLENQGKIGQKTPPFCPNYCATIDAFFRADLASAIATHLFAPAPAGAEIISNVP
jgi:hypothetical protein